MTQRNRSAAHPDLKEQFFADLGPVSHFDALFDHLPGISFFAKNNDFQLVAANQAFWLRLGLGSEQELIGKTDFDLFPRQLAEHFRRDDLEVMRSGRAKMNILELFFNPQGLPDWYLTNKFPLRATSGKVIGVMGTVRSYASDHRELIPYLQLDRAVEHIRKHYTDPIRIAELARMVGLSERQFNRRFQEVFKVSPKNFLIKTRIQAACELLRTSDLPISEIAESMGFYDQSSFTLHFRRQLGVTPLKYRREA